MKEWQCWILFVIGVLGISAFAIWLTSVLSTLTCIYINIIINGIVSLYLIKEGYN